MHPPLFRPHPDCKEMVDELVACHDTNPKAKFWGACNDIKATMDNCFRLEKEKKRALNAKNAREKEKAYEVVLKDEKKTGW
jgi:COX assembly protein 2